MAVFEPCFVNMCSMTQGPDEIRAVHAYNLAIFCATEQDCELVNLESAPSWERGVKSHFRLNINTYRGWKVYMLTTGCIDRLAGFEEEERQIEFDREQEQREKDQASGTLSALLPDVDDK